MECCFFAVLFSFCVVFSSAVPLVKDVKVGDAIDPQPQQVHISATGDVTEMMITWVTTAENISSIVEYGLANQALKSHSSGAATKFVDGGSEKRVLYIHRVKLTGLKPATSYDYHCGSMLGWSSVFQLRTLPEGTDWSPRLCIYGDLGNVNAMSLGYIQEELSRDDFDAILHVGDFAYNMDSDNARIGDAFMNQIVPIASRRPYMTCPGNHEYAYNFSNYRNRFSMPGNAEGLFYSWNVGPAHIISISTEFYYYLQYGIHLLDNQYDWLIADLQKASSPANRAKWPWIIVMGHRPMYCSNRDGDDCTNVNCKVRVGLTSKNLFPLESLLYKYGVDIMIWAHEHSYERLFPIYDQKIYNGSTKFPFTNPRAPVHIITGSGPRFQANSGSVYCTPLDNPNSLILFQDRGHSFSPSGQKPPGCSEHHDPFTKKPAYFTAARALDYGYTRMKIYNSTHVFMDQVSIDKGGKVIDNMWLIKEKHGPEAWN